MQSQARSHKCRKGKCRRAAVCDRSNTRGMAVQVNPRSWCSRPLFHQQSSNRSKINKNYHSQLETVHRESCLVLRDLKMNTNPFFFFVSRLVESLHLGELHKKFWSVYGAFENVLSILFPHRMQATTKEKLFPEVINWLRSLNLQFRSSLRWGLFSKKHF